LKPISPISSNCIRHYTSGAHYKCSWFRVGLQFRNQNGILETVVLGVFLEFLHTLSLSLPFSSKVPDARRREPGLCVVSQVGVAPTSSLASRENCATWNIPRFVLCGCVGGVGLALEYSALCFVRLCWRGWCNVGIFYCLFCGIVFVVLV